MIINWLEFQFTMIVITYQIDFDDLIKHYIVINTLWINGQFSYLCTY